MSMQTECIYGIGFQIKIEPDQLQKFLQNHKESLKQLKGVECILKCLDLDEDDFEDALLGFEYWPNNGFGDSLTATIAATIADIMGVETGLHIAYYPPAEDDDQESILYERAYAQEMNDKERNLTKDELITIFEKYAKELNPNIEVDDDIALEFYS